MPWPQSARFREQRVGSITYNNGITGQPNLFRLRNAGYLERILMNVNINFAYTTAGPTGVDAYGQYTGPLQRVLVTASTSAKLFDLPAILAKMVTWLDSQYRYGSPPVGAIPASITGTSGFPYVGPPDNFVSAPALVNTTDNWFYDIPIALNLVNRPWPTGLFQLAILAQETDLDVRFSVVGTNTTGSPGAGVYTGNTANLTVGPTGLCSITQIFYDPIAQPVDQPSLAFVHQWTGSRVFITGDGDTEIRLPQNVFYLRLIGAYVQGASGALAFQGWNSPAAGAATQGVITRLRIMYGANVTPIDLFVYEAIARSEQMYGAPFPPGFYAIDLLEDTHTERDQINAGATTDVRLVLSTSGGTYSGGAYFELGTEQLVPIPIQRAGQALTQGVAA